MHPSHDDLEEYLAEYRDNLKRATPYKETISLPTPKEVEAARHGWFWVELPSNTEDASED